MAKRPDPGVDDRRRQARAAQQAALARAKRRRTLTQLAIVGGVAVVVIAIIATAVVLGTRGQDAPAASGGPVATGTTTVDGTSVPFAIGGSGDTAQRRPRRRCRRQGHDGPLGRLLLPALPGVRGDEQRHAQQPRGLRASSP